MRFYMLATTVALGLAPISTNAEAIGFKLDQMDNLDSIAVYAWAGGDMAYVADNIPMVQAESEFEQRRVHKAKVDDVESRLNKFRSSYDSFYFEFTDLPVFIGDYDFDKNTQWLCLPGLLGVTKGTGVTVMWSNDRCLRYKDTPDIGNMWFNQGRYLGVQFDNPEQGQRFDEVMRAKGVKVSFECGFAQVTNDRGFRLTCLPYKTSFTTLDGKEIYSFSVVDGVLTDNNPYRN